ncbi:MAG: V-type ATP synthase subunit I [Myxococcota bacterium]
MSIVPLRHVSIIGPLSSKDVVLEGLQAMGLLHVISLAPPKDRQGPGLRAEATKALRYLQTAPIQRAPSRREAIDLLDVERKALELMAREADLSDERDYLVAKARALASWGDFAFPELGALGRGPAGPVRLWFYEVPSYRLSRLESLDLAWEVVAREPGMAYVVVLSDTEPRGLPVERTQAGAAPLSAVRRRLVEVREQMEEIVFERAHLTKYRVMFESHIDDILDGFERENVANKTLEDGSVFVLGGWMAAERLDDLRRFCEVHQLAFTERAPASTDQPPTLLENRGLARAGQSLVTFYSTPGYFEWDPSWVVLASFTMFFAMIMSDAGYALLLLAVLTVFWGRLGRSLGAPLRGLAIVILVLSVAWGVAVGSYFGITPDEAAFLARLQVLSLDDYDTMMRISVSVGAFHVVMANLLRAAFIPRSGVLGAVGWCIAVGTGLGLWLTQDDPELGPKAMVAAPWMLGGSALLILAFSSSTSMWPRRLIDGARSLTKVTTMFGDVLSYLRLFALGLASTSLALAFNGLAKSASQIEGMGTLLAALVLIGGHSINIGLAIMSGFVHGLRLNFIEFFRWGTTTEGRPFCAFGLRRRAGVE